uniref:Pept_C1 domain-containing protein n=1 Tax=Globodera pallida TaxID=36090 RepID=A0A183CKN1_GLOPA
MTQIISIIPFFIALVFFSIASNVVSQLPPEEGKATEELLNNSSNVTSADVDVKNGTQMTTSADKDLPDYLQNRIEILKKEQQFVDELNKAQDHWTAVVHETFALMDSEQKAFIMGARKTQAKEYKQMPQQKKNGGQNLLQLPKEFDSRKKWPECAGFIGMVTDQGACGSCWAISAAAVLTDRFCIERLKIGKLTHTNHPASYASVQETLEFTPSTDGCGGGWPEKAWKWYAQDGVVTGTDYSTGSGCKPYLIKPLKDGSAVKDSFCRYQCDSQWPYGYKEGRVFKVKNSPTHWHGKAENRVEDMMREILENGPIQIIAAIFDDLFNYRNLRSNTRINVYVRSIINNTDIFEGKGKKVGLHSMKIIGWGEATGSDGKPVEYWLGVNSWSTE